MITRCFLTQPIIRIRFANAPLLLLAWLFLGSCAKIDSTVDTSALPVVEAYLIPGKNIKVKITKVVENTSGAIDSAQAIEGLTVYITHNNLTILLNETDSNTYESDDLMTVEVGEVYSLSFAYNNTEVTATTDVPTKPTGFSLSDNEVEAISFGSGPPGEMPDPIKVSWTNTDGKFHLVVVENIETEPTLINDNENAPERPTFRNVPDNIGSEYDISPMDYQYYGTHFVILFKLNEEYAELYNESGTSSQNLASPYTNIKNGLGIFTGINADTLTLEVTD